MSRQTRTTQVMNLGTSETLLSDNLKGEIVTREELTQFLDDVTNALSTQIGGGLPTIEASRKVIEHYNKGKMAEFDVPGYFLFHGVRVCEPGKSEQIIAKDSLTIEQTLFKSGQNS